jgi:uncharacterized protein (TIGR03435 family)
MKKTLCLSLLAISSALLGRQQEQVKFPLADVHVSKTAPGFVQSFGAVLNHGRYANREATMLQLIASAYGVPEDAISGGPGWVSSDLFDIVAKIPEGTTRATSNLMLQSLLADRFGLAIHKGTSPVPRYVLTVAKSGSKLKAAAGSEQSDCNPQSQGRGDPSDPASMPNIKMACRNLTSAEIATNLRQMAGGYFDHDVIDQTHLDGTWNFDLEWTGRGILAAKGADGISVFAAIEKQLGLKAELQDVPMPSMVIEHVNRKPSANAPDTATALAETPPRFEAASIRPADPSKEPFRGLLYTGGSQMRAGGTLSFLIALSLQIPGNVADDMVIGVPKSVSDQRWEINAKVPATGEGAPTIINGRPTPPPFSVALQMLYALLVEQFQLKSHTENREVTVYALTAPNGKAKMTQANESERSGCKPDPTAPKPSISVGLMLGCKNISMPDLARNLERQGGSYVDHPIVDATGLDGGWNFVMGWTPIAQLANTVAQSANQAPGATAADPGGITLFEAVEKELGLKLVKQKRSIPVIVVDHVSEKPIE